MVYTNINGSAIKGPYQEIKKGKDEYTSSGSGMRTPYQPNFNGKSDNKYGAWGSVYKNKENFVNMHIC